MILVFLKAYKWGYLNNTPNSHNENYSLKSLILADDSKQWIKTPLHYFISSVSYPFSITQKQVCSPLKFLFHFQLPSLKSLPHTCLKYLLKIWCWTNYNHLIMPPTIFSNIWHTKNKIPSNFLCSNLWTCLFQPVFSVLATNKQV